MPYVYLLINTHNPKCCRGGEGNVFCRRGGSAGEGGGEGHFHQAYGCLWLAVCAKGRTRGNGSRTACITLHLLTVLILDTVFKNYAVFSNVSVVILYLYLR